MITVMTTVQVKPGHDGEFNAVWQRACELYQGHPGFRRARLLGHADHPGHWTIETAWESRDQYNLFIRDLGMLWIEEALGMLAEPTVTVYMDVVDETGPTTEGA